MTPIASQAVIAVAESTAMTLVAKATMVSLGALVLGRLVRGQSASTRHLVPAAAFVVLAALAPVSAIVPTRDVPVPVSGFDGVSPSHEVEYSVKPGAPASVTTIPGGAPARGLARTIPSPPMVLLLVWLAGASIALAPTLAGLTSVRRLRRTGLPWRDGEAFVAGAAMRLGLRARVKVLLHKDVAGPMTCGTVRPAIVLPRDASYWDKDALSRAVAHELEHIRRADCLTLFLARAICACYWFHPLVWMLWRRLRLEAERACDDAVLRGVDPEVYADQLVALAERLASRQAPSVLAMAGRGDLAARVSAVLDGPRRRGRVGRPGVAAAFLVAVLLLAVLAPVRVVADVQPGEPQSGQEGADSFEVASVKPNPATDAVGSMGPQPGGRFVMVNGSGVSLITYAYGLTSDDAIVGLPDWVRATRYDVNARAADPNVSFDRLRVMLQSLLRDRFRLEAHRDMQEQPTYALVMARDDGRLGPNLRPADVDCDALRAQIAARTAPPLTPPSPTGPVTPCVMRSRPGTLHSGAVPMDVVATVLYPAVQRVVIDKTGLEGFYEMELDYALPQEVANGEPSQWPSIFTAVEEQLGLKLLSERNPVPVLVIDRIERPTPN